MKVRKMMMLSEIAKAVNGQMHGADVLVTSVDTDSRNIKQAQLFVAIKGERFDGNAYALEALGKGAAAALISDANCTAQPAILVKDTRIALGQLAAYWRNKMTASVIAITGSNGKTTTKEMLVAILAATSGGINQVHATYGNLNNDIGLPLTLLKAQPQHQYIVVEMGMNHLGEIEYLTQIAKPSVAVINNAGTAHIGELGSRENIAKAKGEIFSGLSESGVAVINADSEYLDYWKSFNLDKKIITFAIEHSADVTAKFEEYSSYTTIELNTPDGKVEFNLNLQGKHNVLNALAASACAIALGISNAVIAKGLAAFSGVYGRLEHKRGYAGATLIDDTYNANPDSMKAAIDVLSQMAGQTTLVIGDMGELGEDSAEMHTQVGAYAKAKGIQQLYAIGDLSQNAVKAFGSNAMHFSNVEALIENLKPRMSPKDNVLVKGSRFMRMERVVTQLLESSDDHNNQAVEKIQCC
jgi:UDP-N-acetylmuramoyl-tripeptide--D-alanyl-D-alanine ligase